MIKEILKKKKIKVIIRPNKPKNCINYYDSEKDCYYIDINAPPVEGKANLELIKFLKKQLKIPVTIKSGATSKTKILELHSKKNISLKKFSK
jgi:uncharacterized protein